VSAVRPAEDADPLRRLDTWIGEARDAGEPRPQAVAFVTVGKDGHPSARTVSLKRLERDALLFSSALWTRKAHELADNPHVALLFHWPVLGRQAHITGCASIAERSLASQLFNERDIAHQLQTIVSRQGEQIQEIQPLRDLHAHLMNTTETPPRCPEDWGVIRVTPNTIELWQEAPDRMHNRLLYERNQDEWRQARLAP
jgi:pyridoxamine 5'-phosphate oxidase